MVGCRRGGGAIVCGTVGGPLGPLTCAHHGPPPEPWYRFPETDAPGREEAWRRGHHSDGGAVL